MKSFFAKRTLILVTALPILTACAAESRATDPALEHGGVVSSSHQSGARQSPQPTKDAYYGCAWVPKGQAADYYGCAWIPQ